MRLTLLGFALLLAVLSMTPQIHITARQWICFTNLALSMFCVFFYREGVWPVVISLGAIVAAAYVSIIKLN